jgi:hypothetical protein
MSSQYRLKGVPRHRYRMKSIFVRMYSADNNMVLTARRISWYPVTFPTLPKLALDAAKECIRQSLRLGWMEMAIDELAILNNQITNYNDWLDDLRHAGCQCDEPDNPTRRFVCSVCEYGDAPKLPKLNMEDI